MRDQTKSLIQRVPAIMTPLLVVAFSATLAKLLWVVLAPPEDVIAAPKLSAPAPIQTQQQSNLGKVIADNHMFGEVKRTAPVVKRPTPKAPQAVAAPEPTEPPIKISLHGIWSSKRATGRSEDSYKATPIVAPKLDAVSQIQADLGDLFGDSEPTAVLKPAPKKNKSSAIMSVEGGNQQMFSENDMLAGGVKVLDIYADKVVLDNRGVRQEIFLADGDQPAPKGSTPKPVRTMPNAVSANLAAARAQQTNAAANSDPRKNRGETLGQRDLRKLREDIINDASLLAQYAAPEPLLINGQVKGYRLHLSNKLRLLYQVGFRPGDVVTELNGVRLQDPSTIQQALYNFVSSDQLSITVMRGQDEETFRYSF
ncbi:type II secretion system protein N [Leucothrix arctica]|uniref:Type II secretion system protein GspC N-terminal domain-containing protein n=1 Tax=Leucothrix arctica TaxID=1481894 RepID=A0A317CBK8_9GAMM|nr:type II secretion system protein N [Leucothrix arctica]PWQ95749.1 hypothetical protein DKT75_11995 [Leucothrix arctica]